MLIVEHYFTAIPGPDTIGFAMSKFIRTPTNTATTGGEVLSNIESWKASIQINYEVTKTMPSQQEIRAAFQRLIAPLKVASDLFKFHQELIVSQIFGTQKVSDEDVLLYFQQTEEKIHSMDTRKPLKFPERHQLQRQMPLIVGMLRIRQKERESRNPSQSHLLLIVDSRRDHRKRRGKREPGSPGKESLNLNRLPPQRQPHLLLLNLLLRKQGEETPLFALKPNFQEGSKSSVYHIRHLLDV